MDWAGKRGRSAGRFEQVLDEPRGYVKACFPEAVKGRGQIDEAFKGRFAKDSKGTDNGYAPSFGFAASRHVIGNELVRLKSLCEKDGLSLSGPSPGGKSVAIVTAAWVSSHEGADAIQLRTTAGANGFVSSSRTAVGIMTRS